MSLISVDIRVCNKIRDIIDNDVLIKTQIMCVGLRDRTGYSKLMHFLLIFAKLQ